MQHLVLVPGLLCSAELFQPQVAALGGGQTVGVADLRGAGSIGEMAERVLAEAPEQFSLGGLSMGGYVAFEVLRRAPERVLRLALIDTNARADLPEQAQRRRELIDIARQQGLFKVQGMLLPFLLGARSMRDHGLVERVFGMAKTFTLEDFAAHQEAIIARPDNRPFLAHVKCPTLIIVGAEDRLTPVKVAEEMAAGIIGSRLEILEDCGHLSTLEQPDAVTELLRAWAAGGQGWV